MKHYEVFIMSREDQKNVLGTELTFQNGFVSNEQLDWWGKLEDYCGQPVVSVRPSGRDGWHEIIILLAKGWIKSDGKVVLDYDTAEAIENVLSDIFAEAENDEYEVFDSYEAVCTKKEWESVKEWVHKNY